MPGNVQVTEQQLNSFTSDMNLAFEMGIDLLDQLDELIAFKQASKSTLAVEVSSVFALVDSFHWTSMVPQCQCLLAPLLLVVLDSISIYDLLVKIIFKLHANLPEDILTGHRERFNTSFKKLKEFYESVSNLQYFQYLISIPSLPAVRDSSVLTAF